MRTDDVRGSREWHSDSRTPVVAAAGLSLGSAGLLALIVVRALQGGIEPGVAPVIGFVALSVALALFFVWSLQMLRARLGERLSVGDYGVRLRGVGGTVEIAWDDIHAVRLGVGFARVPSTTFFTPKALQRVPKPHLDIAVGRDLTPHETRLLRAMRIAAPHRNGFTHSFGVVEIASYPTDDAWVYAVPLQELLPLVAGSKYTGTALDDSTRDDSAA